MLSVSSLTILMFFFWKEKLEVSLKVRGQLIEYSLYEKKEESMHRLLLSHFE